MSEQIGDSSDLGFSVRVYVEGIRAQLGEVSQALPRITDPAALGHIAQVASEVQTAATDVRAALRRREELFEQREATFEQTVDGLLAATWSFAWGRHRFCESELRAHLEWYFDFHGMSDDDFSLLFAMVRKGVADATGTEWVQSGVEGDILLGGYRAGRHTRGDPGVYFVHRRRTQPGIGAN